MDENHQKICKVAVLDDELLWCETLKELLEQDTRIAVVGYAMTQTAAVRLAEKHKPDIFLVDMKLKSKTCSGITATKAILETSPYTDVYILTTSESEDDVRDALSVGAIKYLPKNNSQKLLWSIESFICGGFNPDRIIANGFAKLRKQQVLNDLTKEEMTLMQALMDGVPRAWLSKLLNKSESTIKTQIRSILSKLHVSTTEEALIKIKKLWSYKLTHK